MEIFIGKEERKIVFDMRFVFLLIFLFSHFIFLSFRSFSVLCVLSTTISHRYVFPCLFLSSSTSISSAHHLTITVFFIVLWFYDFLYVLCVCTIKLLRNTIIWIVGVSTRISNLLGKTTNIKCCDNLIWDGHSEWNNFCS